MNTIEQDLVVAIDYVLTNSKGEVIDASAEGSPLYYLHGHQNIIPGLERELVGLGVGDEKNVVVQPADGYGEYSKEAQQLVPISSLPPELQQVQPGMTLQARDPQSGVMQVIRVGHVTQTHVLLDYNHELAGQVLHFQVKVVDMRAASSEEITHGHVHN